MGIHDAAGSQYQGTDSCLLATRRRECLPTPLGRNNSVRHNTTNTTTTTTTASSGLFGSMNRSRRRSGDNEPAAYSLAGERMMSAEEYSALPRSIQYVTCFPFLLRLSSPAHGCHVHCSVCSLHCLASFCHESGACMIKDWSQQAFVACMPVET
jgi:hypothetical protein